jgi:1-acyl-sn-glycerol-3-phosphate acyltransferase
MIYAKHNSLADLIFEPYLFWLFKKTFYALHLLGEVPTFEDSRPLLLLPNHSTWWDGFFIYLLNKKFIKRKVYLMMLEEQLLKNRYFKYLGAYSIHNSVLKGNRESLIYTQKILSTNSHPPPLVCIFPQGMLLPWGKRPIQFKRGVDFIMKHLERPIEVCLLSIRVEFLNEQRPEVYFLFNKIQDLKYPFTDFIKTLEKQTENLLYELAYRIIREEKGMLLFRGKNSINHK